jgi:hypothetical protein
MLEDTFEELKLMSPPSPPPSSLVARGDRTCQEHHQPNRKRLSVRNGGVLGTTSHSDGTITSPPFGYLHRAPMSDGRVRRSPSLSKRWRTKDEVPSAAPLPAAAGTVAAIALARHLIEASYPALRSHHGRVQV